MDSSFGARLRLQRERQQISLSDIAESTKIKASLLAELEDDNLSHWPRGIFRRSYIRAYAQSIGLNPDHTVREFLQRYPDPEEDVQTALDEVHGNGNGHEPTKRRPPTRLRFLIGSAINALPSLRFNAGSTNGHSRPARAPVPEAETVEVEPFQAAEDIVEEVVALPPDELDEAAAMETIEAPGGEPLMTDAADAAIDAAPMLMEQPPDQPTVERRRVNFSALAVLCTRLGRALAVEEITPALRDAAAELGAVGLILWMPDQAGTGLRPALAHGYSDEILARLPCVPSHTDNAIAAAFRAVETRVVSGNDSATGALVVPLSAPTRCAGVLALELRHGAEQDASVRAFATILAAQLSTLFEPPSFAQAVNA